MAKMINKMLNMMGWNEEDDEEYEEDETFSPEQKNPSTLTKGKVVNIHTSSQLKVVVMQPEEFEDAQEICDSLKSKKPVIVNLEELDVDTARRIIDFLSGAIYSLDGNIQKVSNGIFLVAPYNVDILGNFKDELKSKGVLPFI